LAAPLSAPKRRQARERSEQTVSPPRATC